MPLWKVELDMKNNIKMQEETNREICTYIIVNGSRIKNLKEEIFGFLKVNEFMRIENRYAIWECKCLKCGNTCEVNSKDLIGGRRTTCKNCGEPRNSGRRKGKKRERRSLVGRDFAWLHVEELVNEDSKKQIYLCRCRCGNLKEVSETNLISGNTKSCGCMPRTNIKDKRFGMLVAIEPTNQKTSKGIIWKCKCDCGNIAYISVEKLNAGDVRSCGCMREVEKSEHTKLTWVLNKGQKLRANNTSGIRGVKRANGKWGASITFKGKTYWLGTFSEKEDAIYARKTAEEHFYSDFLIWFEEYKEQRSNAKTKDV